MLAVHRDMDHIDAAIARGLLASGLSLCRLRPRLPWQEVVAQVSLRLGCQPAGFNGTADCPGVNRIALGMGRYRSTTGVALGLHQEGYEDCMPARLLVLYCEEADPGSGRTLIADALPLMGEFEGQRATVRFRKNGASFTPWRPLVERVSNKRVFRFAEPEAGFREVELRCALAMTPEVLTQRLRERMICHAWSEGDLLIIDNWRCLHGRETIGELQRRMLLRMVF